MGHCKSIESAGPQKQGCFAHTYRHFSRDLLSIAHDKHWELGSRTERTSFGGMGHEE